VQEGGARPWGPRACCPAAGCQGRGRLESPAVAVPQAPASTGAASPLTPPPPPPTCPAPPPPHPPSAGQHFHARGRGHPAAARTRAAPALHNEPQVRWVAALGGWGWGWEAGRLGWQRQWRQATVQRPLARVLPRGAPGPAPASPAAGPTDAGAPSRAALPGPCCCALRGSRPLTSRACCLLPRWCLQQAPLCAAGPRPEAQGCC
jgi:hypothetical protein